MNDLELEIERRATSLVEKKEEQPPLEYFHEVSDAVTQVKGQIVERAVEKVQAEKIIDKHSDRLAEISDKAIEAETETQELYVEEKKADNKVKRQEIKNKLIELKTEAIRLSREQKQILKEQKQDHKKRNADAKWALYKGKLEKMGYSYVPNRIVLGMLLFFDGMQSFFNGIGAVSTSILKALKWIIGIGLILGVLMIVPLTRDYILRLLDFVK